MRYTGGFMPYGAKEKADDVPARLSKNEFVFTADAVRAAGGGSVNEGAKKMYATMKQLEKKPEAKGMIA
jgi:predicted house-cleaning NTP pyrophosphatase (Maf/HAM1 superfamily)